MQQAEQLAHEISHDEGIYTLEIGKCYKSGLWSPHGEASFYTLTTTPLILTWLFLVPKSVCFEAP